MVSKYEDIDSLRSDPANTNPVMLMCPWLQVSTSGFYHWRSRLQLATSVRREQLVKRTIIFFEDSEGVYGYRCIHADMRAEAIECSPGLVRQMMKDEGLVPCQVRPYKVAT